MTFRVIAHPDCAGPAAVQDLFQCAPALFAQVRDREMDQVEIDIAEAQAIEGSVEGLQRGVIAMVVIPELGGDEDFFARESAVTDRPPHIFFIAVETRGIYKTVAGFESRPYRLIRFLAGTHKVNTQAQQGHEDSVI